MTKEQPPKPETTVHEDAQGNTYLTEGYSVSSVEAVLEHIKNKMVYCWYYKPKNESDKLRVQKIFNKLEEYIESVRK